jgi:putative endonuclease
MEIDYVPLACRSEFFVDWDKIIPICNVIHIKGASMQHTYYICILANRTRRLYIGATNNLIRRIHEHRTGERAGFTRRYNIRRLVYWESSTDPRDAIRREKPLKGWRREKKTALIESMNPDREVFSLGF